MVRGASSASYRPGPGSRERHHGQRRMTKPHRKAEHMAASTSGMHSFEKPLLTEGRPHTGHKLPVWFRRELPVWKAPQFLSFGLLGFEHKSRRSLSPRQVPTSRIFRLSKLVALFLPDVAGERDREAAWVVVDVDTARTVGPAEFVANVRDLRAERYRGLADAEPVARTE